MCVYIYVCIPFLIVCRSLEEQMEQAALTYLDLLEGKDKPVAGSTCEYKNTL